MGRGSGRGLGQNGPAIGVGSDVSNGEKWAWSGGLNEPTIGVGSDVSNGEKWAWSGGLNGPTIDTGSDISYGEGQWAWFGVRTGLQ